MNRAISWIVRAKLAALVLLNPWRTVRQLREENERLAKVITDPLLTGIHMGNGTLNVGLEGPGPQLVAGMFLGMLEKYPDAKNYIEATFGSRMGPILVTVMRPGGKTPDQLRREAERKLAEHLNGNVRARQYAHDKGYWYCQTCGTAVPPECVTYEETHDPRYGGCGETVE